MALAPVTNSPVVDPYPTATTPFPSDTTPAAATPPDRFILKTVMTALSVLTLGMAASSGKTRLLGSLFVDIDGTLLKQMLIRGNTGALYILVYRFLVNPVQWTWRMGVRGIIDVALIIGRGIVHLFRSLDPNVMQNWGTKALRRMVKGVDLEKDAEIFYHSFLQDAINWRMVRIVRKLKGSRVGFSITSEPDPLARIVTDKVGLDVAISSEVVRGPGNTFDQLVSFIHGKTKGPAAKAAHSRFDRSLELASGGSHRLDPDDIVLIADKPHDLAILHELGGGSVIASGTGMDKELAVRGGVSIVFRDGATIYRLFKKFGDGLTEKFTHVVPTRTFSEAERFSGLGLVPLQWMVGDTASEGTDLLNAPAEVATSTATFAAAGAGGELIARGLAHNIRHFLPFFYWGKVADLGLLSGVTHLVGSIAGMTALALTREKDPQESAAATTSNWQFIRSGVQDQMLAWGMSHFLIYGGLGVLKVRGWKWALSVPEGAEREARMLIAQKWHHRLKPLGQGLELSLLPTMEFSLLKMWNPELNIT